MSQGPAHQGHGEELGLYLKGTGQPQEGLGVKSDMTPRMLCYMCSLMTSWGSVNYHFFLKNNTSTVVQLTWNLQPLSQDSECAQVPGRGEVGALKSHLPRSHPLPTVLSLQIEEAQQAPEGQPCLDQGSGARVEDAAVQEVGLAQGWGPPTPPVGLHSPRTFLPQERDAGALSRVCGLLQQLHTAYSGLASSLQGLPAELQQPVKRARRSLCELYGVVASAGSVEALPAEQLVQCREGVHQAWQGLEQLLEGLQHNPPLSWLVGPFALPPGGQQL